MAIPDNLIEYLHANSNYFQKSDALISKYILNKRDLILKMTVTEVAEALNVSDATVIRFCQKIGYKGYYQMKISLAQSLKSPDNSNKIKQSSMDPISYVTDIVIENINSTGSKLDVNILKSVAQVINKAQCVYFFAVGNSYPIAFDAAYKLSRIGIKTFISSSSEMQISNAYFLDEKSVAFGISHSGSSKTVLNIFEIAKSQGATTVLLSNYEKSPLARLSDYILETRAYKEYFFDSGLVTRICAMYYIDVLFFTILTQNNEDYAKIFEEKEMSMSDFTV